MTVFVGTTTGEAQVDAIRAFLIDVVSHEKWKPGSPFLHDLSNFDSGPLRVNDIEQIAGFGGEIRAQFGSGKIAIVAVRDLEFGLSRMLGVLVAEELDSEFEVFRSREEAFAWLSV